jgi:enoyl-[acyl-carrier-protein] reductase (NADH)
VDLGLAAAAAAGQGRTLDEVLDELASRTSCRRSATADEVAAVVTFLASLRAVAVNGDTVTADGGRPGSIWN